MINDISGKAWVVPMEVKKIFFDLDGVLADFDRGVQELCGMEVVPQDQRSPETDNAMWEKIREEGHFYDKLELMPGAKKLFDTVYQKYGDRCEILTGIPKPKRGILTAREDKVNWSRRMLAENVVVNIVFREQKPEYCTGRDCILIDDLEKNIKAWEDLGGTGIHHKDTGSTLLVLKELDLL